MAKILFSLISDSFLYLRKGIFRFAMQMKITQLFFQCCSSGMHI